MGPSGNVGIHDLDHAFSLKQEGYNEESIDVWDVIDGEERIVVPKVKIVSCQLHSA